MIYPEEISRTRKIIPPDLAVVPQSTPIVAFGRFDTAQVASVGINPSHREFLHKSGAPLETAKRRFVSRLHLGVPDGEPLTDVQAEEVVATTRDYFSTNPYKTWFNPMEKWVLQPLGASYWAGTATHLDLSQWATKPVWKDLTAYQQLSLLEQDASFLRWQIHHRRFETVVVNGKGAINQLADSGIATLHQVDQVRFEDTVIELWATEVEGTRFLGWNRYLQSALPTEARQALRDWLSGNR